MFSRCLNPEHGQFSDYGGRGIAICDRWRDYRNFLTDMGRRPSSRHSIDRIDNDGPYSPENCRWATRKEQNHNRRKKIGRPRKAVTVNGETLTLQKWLDRTGVNRRTFYNRTRAGMTDAEALGL